MPYVTVGKENSGNIELYYEDHGSGQPVVLIHGYPLSGASWEKQVPVLLEAGYRVITYDRRGFGKSSQPTAGYNYDTFAEDLRKLVTRLKLQDFTLVGFSMGGGEVARYIGKYGSKGVSKAVIISGVPPYLLKTGDNPEGVDASVFAGIEKAVAADRYAFFTGFFQNFYNTDLLLGKRVSEQAVQASWNIAATASATASLACVPTWHEDFRVDLARIDVLTLVIHGDADRILPITAAGTRTAKLIKGARLVVVKDGPHCVPWTHAEEVNAELLSFLGDKGSMPPEAGGLIHLNSANRFERAGNEPPVRARLRLEQSSASAAPFGGNRMAQYHSDLVIHWLSVHRSKDGKTS
jgi:non-heme chloroperoxidase